MSPFSIRTLKIALNRFHPKVLWNVFQQKRRRKKLTKKNNRERSASSVVIQLCSPVIGWWAGFSCFFLVGQKQEVGCGHPFLLCGSQLGVEKVCWCGGTPPTLHRPDPPPLPPAPFTLVLLADLPPPLEEGDDITEVFLRAAVSDG